MSQTPTPRDDRSELIKESKHRATDYKRAIEVIEYLSKEAGFFIRTKGKERTQTLWIVKVMEKEFRGFDFVEVIREAAKFVVEAHKLIKP